MAVVAYVCRTMLKMLFFLLFFFLIRIVSASEIYMKGKFCFDKNMLKLLILVNVEKPWLYSVHEYP